MIRMRAALTRKTGTMLRAYQINSSLCGSWGVEGREGGREGGDINASTSFPRIMDSCEREP